MVSPPPSEPVASTAQACLARLIASGVYVAGRLPSERALEEILGVSRTTVRKVIAKLRQDELLSSSRRRAQDARAPRRTPGAPRIAFIAPAFASAGVGRWEDGVRRCLAARHPRARLDSLRYRSRGDPLFREAARGFDGIFLLLGAEAADERLHAALVGPGLAPVLSLEQDLTGWGIPTLDLFPAAGIATVLDRVHALGHRRIGCLNTQPEDAVVAARIAAWRAWLAARRCQGPLVSEPVAPFEDPLPRAHRLMQRCLDRHAGVTAWLCTVVQVARGAIRAIHDRGLVAGREVSIATLDGELQEDYLVPSLACVAPPDPVSCLGKALSWMLAGPRRSWRGPLRVQPRAQRFHPGESLGPVHA